VLSLGQFSIKRPRRRILPAKRPSYLGQFPYAHGFLHSKTRNYGGLLGPCFKTGHIKSLCLRPKREKEETGESALKKSAPPEAEIHFSPRQSARDPCLTARCSPQSNPRYFDRGYNTTTEAEATFPHLFSPKSNCRRLIHGQVHPGQSPG
jgi:hypothetical protein